MKDIKLMITDHNKIYQEQADLMLKILPIAMGQSCFALKGGTAINLFIRNMPRLSVDIDLTYLPIEPRLESLAGIETGLKSIHQSILKKFPHYKIEGLTTKRDNTPIKLLINSGRTSVKIEPNTILRSALLPTMKKDLTKRAEEIFNLTVLDIPILSFEEVYAGKICAALDRQHPRDLFDIKILFDYEGLTATMLDAFVVYLASSPRPINEMLNPNLQDIQQNFDSDFAGMSYESIDYESLLAIRKKLIKEINDRLTDDHRYFLLSVKQGDPDLSKMPFDNLLKFPALQWKIMNIRKMDHNKHLSLVNKLKKVLRM